MHQNGVIMKRTPVLFAILIVLVLASIFGCAPPPVVEEEAALTTEQQKALEDSLREVQLRELKIIRSFAYQHYNNKAWQDAAGYYEQLAEEDTGHVFNDYGKWAQCYIQMSVSVDSVKTLYQRGIAAFPEDAYLHASLGHIFRTQGLLDSAAVHYQAAVQNNPEELEYKKTLAELFTRLNRPMEAIDLYKGILKEEPENKEIAEILDDLVRRYLSPEDYVKSLEESVTRFPEDLDKKLELAKAYTDIGRNEKALTLLETVIQQEPNDISALETLGNVQQNLRNYTAAINAYMKILTIEPDNTRIMVEISNCHRQSGQFFQARTYARKALAKDSQMGSAHSALAAIYETAADQKTGGKPPGYSDKLVFLVAYGLYQDAKNTGDYQVLSEAENHMKYLKESQLIPAYADWFMHQDKTDPTEGSGYEWIQSGWPELRFIQSYLDKISQK